RRRRTPAGSALLLAVHLRSGTAPACRPSCDPMAADGWAVPRRVLPRHVTSAFTYCGHAGALALGSNVPIVLQKSPSGLCEIEICNNRIGAPVLLDRCCAFQPDLESIFLAEMLKILLQHYLPLADICVAAKFTHSITSSARASSVAGTSRP